MTSTFPEIRYPSDASAAPVLVSIPHSGVAIPQEERSTYAVDPDTLLRDGDLHVDHLCKGAEEEGATVVQTPWSRFVVDLNRYPDDVHPSTVEGGSARKQDGYLGKRGVIWGVTTHGASIYSQPLSREAFERRLARYYTPYHSALRNELKRLHDRFGYAVLLDAHSMPSVATRMHPDPGAERADIVPGDLNGRACDASLMTLTLDHWTSRGYSVSPNAPYRGGGITRQHGRPKEGIHALQLEINRAAYMDERTFEMHEGAQRVQADLRVWVASVTQWAP